MVLTFRDLLDKLTELNDEQLDRPIKEYMEVNDSIAERRLILYVTRKEEDGIAANHPVLVILGRDNGI